MNSKEKISSSDKLKRSSSSKKASNKHFEKENERIIEDKTSIKIKTDNIEKRSHKSKNEDEIADLSKHKKKIAEEKSVFESEEEKHRRRKQKSAKENDFNSEFDKNIDKHEKSNKKEKIDEDYKKRNKATKQKDEFNSKRNKNDFVETTTNDRQKREKEDLNLKQRSKIEEIDNKTKLSKAETVFREKDGQKSRKKEENRRKTSFTDAKGDKMELLVEKSFLTTLNDKKNEIGDYEEDFEDYNDDFEEFNSSSTAESAGNIVNEDSEVIKEVLKPIESAELRKKAANKNEEGIHTSFINFRMAQKKCSKDAVANKMLLRAYDLSRLIEFDRSHFDIVDIAPVLEHSKYMLLFGRVGCQQVGTQVGDDNMSRETQTEVIEERTLWSQHPPLDDQGCVKVMLDLSNNRSNFLLSNEMEKTALQILSEEGASSAPLTHVLELMDRVLEEEACSEVATKISSTQNGSRLMSVGYNKYNCEGTLCTLGCFASGNSGIFATVHQRSRQSSAVDKTTNNKDNDAEESNSVSYISTWRVSSNRREPQRLLSCPSYRRQRSSDIVSLTFSPDPSVSHLIAGLDSGLLALWDLREPPLLQSTTTTAVADAPGDPPSYLTAVGATDRVEEQQQHQAPVISLHTHSQSESPSAAYQLLSLDSLGNLYIWVVSSLVVHSSSQWALASGSLADLSLRPGSRSRMSIVATVSLLTGANCMTVDPCNSGSIFIGTNDGKIIHYDRGSQQSSHSSRTHSSVSRRTYGDAAGHSATVTHLDFYPFFEPYLLAAYNDGSAKIFALGRSEPLMSFCDGSRSPLIKCRWSQSHPAVFFTLNTVGSLQVWNILTSSYRPAVTQALPGYIGFELSCDSRWLLKEKKTAANSKARLLLWALQGAIEVHELHPDLVEAELDACFKTCALLQSLL